MTFNALVNQGFTVVNQDCQVTVTAHNLTAQCFYLALHRLVGDSITGHNNPNGSWTYTFTQSGTPRYASQYLMLAR
ncbi:MAG: hypothetical protein IPO69_02550 [Saprospiraceae bacterium]|nr:hypothetical protein [Saprospiraceae bacterium]